MHKFDLRMGGISRPGLAGDWGRFMGGGWSARGEGWREVGLSSKLTSGQFLEESGSFLPPVWVLGAGEPDSELSGPQQQSLGQCMS